MAFTMAIYHEKRAGILVVEADTDFQRIGLRENRRKPWCLPLIHGLPVSDQVPWWFQLL